MFLKLTKPYLGKPAGEQVEVPDADQAKNLITIGVAEEVKGDPIGLLIEKQVGGLVEKLTKSLDETITAAVKAVADAQTRSKKNAVPLIFGEGNKGDPDHNFGDFCVCVATKNYKRLDEHYQSFPTDATGSRISKKAAMGESSGSTGGYIVPPDFYNQLLAIISENSIMRSRAWVQPMASATLQFPYLDVTTVQSAGVSPFFGGVQMYWTEEAQVRTETEPQFKMMELKAHELSGYSVSSNVLLADAAFGLEKFLFQLFGQAISWFEDYAFFQGNSVGKPLGLLNAPATITAKSNSGGTARITANQIQFGDVAFMWSKLLPASWGKACWAFSPTCVPQLLQLKDGASRAIFISIDQGIAKAPTWSLMGRPAIPTEKLPALGTAGDIILFDPSMYVIGDRMQIEVAASEHVNFLYNQMTWRVVERVDGQPWLENPITLQDATSQVSPFVILHA
jgi:HK97 family phage major capsid protein